jgi:hypothetical protein
MVVAKVTSTEFAVVSMVMGFLAEICFEKVIKIESALARNA